MHQKILQTPPPNKINENLLPAPNQLQSPQGSHSQGNSTSCALQSECKFGQHFGLKNETASATDNLTKAKLLGLGPPDVHKAEVR